MMYNIPPFQNCLITALALLLLFIATGCDGDPDPPMIASINPAFSPAETLITIEGSNLADIREMRFSDQIINFNTAYNSDNALLFRVPTNVPVGEHVVTITTDGGSTTTDFRVTLDAPEIFRFSPRSADVGEPVSIVGKNFFDPLMVHFRTSETDSVAAEIIFQQEDSVVVLVPEDVVLGPIIMDANGGVTYSPVTFFTTVTTPINDFDGNGIRSETNLWQFIGFTDQLNASQAISNGFPGPINGNFLKISGTDNLNTIWLGGPQSNLVPEETFGITTENGATVLLELDVNNAGFNDTYLLIVLREEGNGNDFTRRIPLDEPDWQSLSIPLNRFEDVNGLMIDPTLVNQIKFHLEDRNETGTRIEANIDNVRFIERQ